MDTALNAIASTVRSWMGTPAKFLNHVSGGRITPNQVTLVSLLGHFTVIWALWDTRPVLAAFLLAFFGIMDTLDGALARLQKRASLTGMLYDAVSDRVKEIMVYIGLAFYLQESVGLSSVSFVSLPNWYGLHSFPLDSILIAVCGLSIVVSYIKAKGEMALSSTGKYDAQKLNRVFADGVARYEVRMVLIFLGLLTNTIFVVLHVLLILLIFTCLQRLVRVTKALKDV